MSGGGIYIDETPTSQRSIPDVPTAITAFIDFFATGPTAIPTPIPSFAAFQQIFGGLDPRSEASYQLLQFFTNGGQSAIVYNVAVEPSSPLFVSALKSALASLTLPVNLLTLPATANLAPPDAHAVMLAAQTFCTTHRAFYIADIPPSTVAATPAAIEAWFANTGLAAIDSAAVYYPRLTIADPLHPTLSREIASSGTVAGIYAHTDSTQGVWKSPAGTSATIANATPVASLTDLDSNALNALGINPIRTFPGHGTVIWGARTSAGGDPSDSNYRYVNVRRLAIYIESSLQDPASNGPSSNPITKSSGQPSASPSAPSCSSSGARAHSRATSRSRPSSSNATPPPPRKTTSTTAASTSRSASHPSGPRSSSSSASPAWPRPAPEPLLKKSLHLG